MSSTTSMTITDRKKMSAIAEALSSETRLAIITACQDRFLGVTEIGESLGLTQPAISAHIKILQEAGLMEVKEAPGIRGKKKLCRTQCKHVTFSLQALTDLQYEDTEIDMPVGLFTRVHVSPLCGLAGPEGAIGILDVTKSFLHPDRVKAGLIWFEKGWIEYAFPNNVPVGRTPERLELSFEACSEAPDYNPDWPSDITVWINGKKLGVWTSPGDYGGARGRLTPAWWKTSSTQYGLLKTWSVTEKGTYLDDAFFSDVTLGDLDISHDAPLVVRIGIEEDASNSKGLNLFGETFGNHPQGIKLKMTSRIES